MAMTVIHTINGANVKFALGVVLYGIFPHLMTQFGQCAAFCTLYGFGIIVFELMWIWIQFHSNHLSIFVGMVSFSSSYQFPINMSIPTNCPNGTFFSQNIYIENHNEHRRKNGIIRQFDNCSN